MIGGALVWLILVAGFGLAVFPLTARLFRGWADAGYGVTRTLGLIITGWLSWLLASTGILPQRGWTILLLLAAVGGCCWLGRWRRDALEALRNRLRSIAWAEAIFIVSFVVFYVAFTMRPHAHLGERPMDLAFFSACWRAETFPPADPWFAGGTINYYYFGHALSAMLAKAAGLVPSVAYPLSVALLPALFLSSAFSLFGRLLGGVRLAAAGTVALLLMGNLYVLAEGHLLYGAFDMHAFLRSVQVIPHGLNEYPFFSFLVAELHAHVLAAPMEMLLLCVLCKGLKDVPSLGIAGITLGALAATNTWSVAVYAPLALIALLSEATPGGTVRASVRAVLSWVGILAMGWVLFLPFHLKHDPYPVKLEWLGETTTRISDLGILYGLVLFVILPSFFAQVRLYLAPRLRLSLRTLTLGIAGVAFLGAVSIRSGIPATLLLPLLCLAVPLGLGGPGDPRERFLGALFLMGIAIIYGCEVLNVRGFLEEPSHRYNTIMRFHFSAMLLLGIVASDRLVRGAAGLLGRQPVRSPEKVWIIASVALFVLAATPPVRAIVDYVTSGTGPQAASLLQGPGGPSPEEVAAIRWLNREVEGQPVLLESTGRSYDFRACRISSHTGLPTLIGWLEKQREWNRPDGEVGARLLDITRIYGAATMEEILPILKERSVRYIFVGPWERHTFPPEGLAKLDSLPRLFESGETRIYEVPPR